MGRAPCCDKGSVKKGPWSPEEDRKLREYIHSYGTGGNWIALPTKAGLRRCGKSCRLRWLNYLRPNIRHGGFSDEEDRLICGLFATIGSRWSVIAAQLPGRTDNDIKNYWNTKLKKKLHLLVAAMAQQPPPPLVTTSPCSSFSLEQQHHHGGSSGAAPSPWEQVVFGVGAGGQQHISPCSVDNGGLHCFDISSNDNGNVIRNNGTAVGLESFMFGGLQLQQQEGTTTMFPAAAENDTGHNKYITSGGLLLQDHQHQRQYGGSYEHGMNPLMISPSSNFFYGNGEAADGATRPISNGLARHS